MRPDWLEIPTKDIESSKEFYSKVLGWKYEDRKNGMTLIRDGKGQFGHFWPLKGRLPARPQVCIYLEVSSISPILKKVIGNGGKIVQDKRKLPDGMGYVGEFSDPIGIVWGLHSRK